MSTSTNPWHPWRLRKVDDGMGYEILRADGWMVWADITHPNASDDDIRAAITRAEKRRAAWLETVR